MMKWPSFILFLIIISCQSNELSDLKFPFPGKEGILENSIDSTFLVSEYNSIKDTVGLITYDKQGRILYDGSDPWKSYHYKYDSFGIVTSRLYRDWDVYFRFNATYDFSSDSLLLIHNWSGDYPYMSTSKFDSHGNLIEESSRYLNETIISKTICEYNENFKLIGKLMISYDGPYVTETKTSVFYTNLRLDSVVTEINTDIGWNSRIVDYYDKLGLRHLTVKNVPDTILPKVRYIHKKRSE